MRHLLTLFDLSVDEIGDILAIAQDLKEKHAHGTRDALFPGRVLGLLFEKPSLRTRVSFEAAMAHLGGNSLYLGKDVGWGERESTADFSRVLSQYVDVVVCRSKSHQKVEELASFAECPVINGLTDRFHPCQAIADLFTLREVHGTLAGRKLAFVGDANNVAQSLAVACAKLGVRFAIASPEGYRFPSDFVARMEAEFSDLNWTLSDDPAEVVKDADAVYTDVWASMGQEAEKAERKVAFADYQVNAKLMAHAPKTACFLHCLPAHRGSEVTDEVIDGPQSRIVRQAANRMHAQKGIIVWLLQKR